MKKLSTVFLLAVIFVACSNENEEKKEEEKSDFQAPETACDCSDRTMVLIEQQTAGEDVTEELEKISQACKDLMNKIGEDRYMAQIEACTEDLDAEGIAIDTTLAQSVTPCDCHSKISELFERAEKGEDITDEMADIDNACKELGRLMGEDAYTTALAECK